MLGTIVLLLCLAGLAVAAGIAFVVLGPVPVKRRVAMVSRVQPLPLAAGPVALPGPFDPAQASFSPPQNVFEPEATQYAAAVELPPPPPPSRKAPPPITPLQLRRPRSGPAPLARNRSARGTEQRRQSFEVEHTAPDVPMFEVDDPTFLEDGH